MELNGKAMLEGYELHVTSEDYDHGGKVTSHKTESGIDLTDHTESDPQVVSLSGILTRPTQERVQTLINKLLDWKENGTKLQYEGRQIVPNVLIESLSYNADKNIANGFNFSMTLKKVRFGETSYTPQTKPVTNSGQKQTKNKNEEAVYHVVKRGDTYWGQARKYGTTVKQLEEWNPWPARGIPIGVKMRVG
ncbi:LysM peptidoglycan-binding domain-containing protein [Virgibacillus sediminis]|uniref:LysM peptidoglycan-binding domain-containing protein n=1 Tax=Virgibacillus sediminis TaxID=202260 RepID=A0ABV7A6Y1_9BACI